MTILLKSLQYKQSTNTDYFIFRPLCHSFASLFLMAHMRWWAQFHDKFAMQLQLYFTLVSISRNIYFIKKFLYKVQQSVFFLF